MQTKMGQFQNSLYPMGEEIKEEMEDEDKKKNDFSGEKLN